MLNFDKLAGYLDARLDEYKLKTVNALSQAFSSLLSTLILVLVALMLLGLLSYAFLQWLNTTLGAPWGTLIVCGALAVLLLVLWLLRKKMFKDTFVKTLISVLYDDKK